MTENLIKLLTDQVTNPAVLGKLGSMLGESESNTKTAVNGAIPSILGALMQSGANVNGAQNLLSMMNKLPSGMDGNNITDLLGGLLGNSSQQNNVMNLGSNMLTSILGNKAGGMFDMISALSGIGRNKSSSLMGMLMPLAMGMLKRKLAGSALGGAAGLAQMLLSQRGFLKAAAPKGLAGALGMSSLDGFDDMAKSLESSLGNLTGKVATPSTPSFNAPKASVPSVATPKAAGGLGRFLLPLILIAAIAAGLWWFMNRNNNTVTIPGVDQTTISSICSNMTGLNQAINAFPSLSSTTTTDAVRNGIVAIQGPLQSILNLPATTSIPGVNEVTTGFNTVMNAINDLTGDTVGEASSALSAAFNSFKTATTGVSSNLNCR
ncbi:MAG: DUF937 domain-containing protein [Deinococcales bacterium]